MNLTGGQVNWYLLAVEGVGAVFFGLFLTVYLLGLRDVTQNVVYHSEPFFRTLLSILGASLIGLVLIGFSLLVLRARANAKRNRTIH
jgi:uncharacterized membrane protein